MEKNLYDSAVDKFHNNENLTREEKSEIFQYLLVLESENNSMQEKISTLDNAIRELIYTLKTRRLL